MPQFPIMLTRSALLFAMTLAIAGCDQDPFDDRIFSQATWLTGNYKVRAPMARSAVKLISTKLTKAEVEGLLGPPDTAFTGEDPGGNKFAGAETSGWNIGNWSSYGFDDAWVYVSYDSNQHVVSAEINGY